MCVLRQGVIAGEGVCAVSAGSPQIHTVRHPHIWSLHIRTLKAHIYTKHLHSAPPQSNRRQQLKRRVACTSPVHCLCTLLVHDVV